MDDESYAGRGSQATSDMKARIAAMTRRGLSMEHIVETLWQRHVRAELGDGYSYEHSPETDLVRPDGL